MNLLELNQENAEKVEGRGKRRRNPTEKSKVQRERNGDGINGGREEVRNEGENTKTERQSTLLFWNSVFFFY